MHRRYTAELKNLVLEQLQNSSIEDWKADDVNDYYYPMPYTKKVKDSSSRLPPDAPDNLKNAQKKDNVDRKKMNKSEERKKKSRRPKSASVVKTVTAKNKTKDLNIPPKSSLRCSPTATKRTLMTTTMSKPCVALKYDSNIQTLTEDAVMAPFSFTSKDVSTDTSNPKTTGCNQILSEPSYKKQVGNKGRSVQPMQGFNMSSKNMSMSPDQKMQIFLSKKYIQIIDTNSNQDEQMVSGEGTPRHKSGLAQFLNHRHETIEKSQGSLNERTDSITFSSSNIQNTSNILNVPYSIHKRVVQTQCNKDKPTLSSAFNQFQKEWIHSIPSSPSSLQQKYLKHPKKPKKKDDSLMVKEVLLLNDLQPKRKSLPHIPPNPFSRVFTSHRKNIKPTLNLISNVYTNKTNSKFSEISFQSVTGRNSPSLTSPKTINVLSFPKSPLVQRLNTYSPLLRTPSPTLDF